MSVFTLEKHKMSKSFFVFLFNIQEAFIPYSKTVWSKIGAKFSNVTFLYHQKGFFLNQPFKHTNFFTFKKETILKMVHIIKVLPNGIFNVLHFKNSI